MSDEPSKNGSTHSITVRPPMYEQAGCNEICPAVDAGTLNKMAGVSP